MGPGTELSMTGAPNAPLEYGVPLDDVPVAILVLDGSGRALDANGAWCELTNQSVFDSQGAGWLDALDPKDRERAQEAVVEARRVGALTIDEWRIRRAPGREAPSGLATVTARIRRTTANLLVAALVDTTYWSVRLADLEQMARHDPLTGLLNRTVLANHVRQALVRAERSGRPPTLLFIDLNNFKYVNDTFGHPVGDQVLETMADRLHLVCRDADTLARVGGDEFALLCEEVSGRDIEKVIDRLKRAASEPIDAKGHEVTMSISVGVAVGNPASDSFESMLERADRALYAEKRGSRLPHPDHPLLPRWTETLMGGEATKMKLGGEDSNS